MTQFKPQADPENINSEPSSHLKDFLILMTGFCGLLGAIYYGLIFGGEFLALRMSHQIEQKIFDHLPVPFEKTKPLPNSAQIIWNELLKNLNFPAQASVLCYKEPNAFALPGHKVFLTSSLLENIKTRGGLAFVMAHELGHIEHRDHLRHLGRIAGALLTLATLGLAEPNLDTSTIENLISRNFDRSQESAADEFGLKLVKKTFQSIKDTSEFFRYLLTMKDRPDQSIPVFISTHPEVTERLKIIEKEERSFNTERITETTNIDLKSEIVKLCGEK